MHISTIILDTNEYIYGLGGTKKECEDLINRLPNFNVKVPRIILNELYNNLGDNLIKDLYRLLRFTEAEIIEKKVPISLIDKYKVPYEDAVIASYCEYLKVDALISENRHFLIDFHPKSFKIFSAHDFLKSGLA